MYDASLSFVAVPLIAVGLANWLTGLRYQGIVDAKSAEIKQLTVQADSLRGEIKDLQELVGKRQTSASSAVARGPDDIHQFDTRVGRAFGALEDRSHSVVTFVHIYATGDFDVAKDFEYRDLVLRIIDFPTWGRSSVGNQTKEQFMKISCAITGYTGSSRQ